MSCDGDATASARPGRPGDLQLTVVHYSEEPDRCTIAPPTTAECDRTTTWLSVNRSVLEDLETRR